MALIVQKYGGTSVGNPERIKNVAKRVARFHAQGHQVVVVVSAMSGETNKLIALAKEVQASPDPRELDQICATGEQVTIGLLSMALMGIGVPARSYTGGQVKVLTDSTFTKARILSIDEANMRADLDAGKVVVVAGFQGVDADGNITTLGRGGSDTSGVALAAALKADECQIYTDVDGVYTTDPRVVPEAKKLDTITFEEMLEMASLGSKGILGAQRDRSDLDLDLLAMPLRCVAQIANRGSESDPEFRPCFGFDDLDRLEHTPRTRLGPRHGRATAQREEREADSRLSHHPPLAALC